jgi:hypothetical protein
MATWTATRNIRLLQKMVSLSHVGVVDGNGRVVAITGPENDLESQTDARIIAQLPELLAVLEELATRYDRLEKLYAPRYDAENGTLARARSLLAKIKAQSPE